MSIPVPTSEPTELYIGANATWLKSLPDYLAGDGWQVNYYIRGQAGEGADFLWSAEVTSSDDDFLVSAAATKLASMTPGDHFRLIGEAVNGADKAVFYDGSLTLKPAANASIDVRTHAQKVLDAIEATLEGRASREEASLSVTFGGQTRQISFLGASDLLALKSHYQQIRNAEIAQERIDAGQGSGRLIKSNWVSTT